MEGEGREQRQGKVWAVEGKGVSGGGGEYKW